MTDTTNNVGEIWIDSFTVRFGNTTVNIHRVPTSGLDGDRDSDRWRVVAPKWFDHIGDERWFDSHVQAQLFAGHLAKLLDTQQTAWNEAMQEIRFEWLKYLADASSTDNTER